MLPPEHALAAKAALEEIMGGSPRVAASNALRGVKPLTCDDCPLAEPDNFDAVVWCNFLLRVDAREHGVTWEQPTCVAIVEGQPLRCARAVLDAEEFRSLALRILKTLECAGEGVHDGSH